MSLTFEASSTDKLASAVSDSLVARSISSHGLAPERALAQAKAHGDRDAVQRNAALVERLNKPADGSQDFKFATIPDIARAFLEQTGQQCGGMATPDAIRRAVAQTGTGSLTSVLLDAANKTLLAAYDEAEVTYPMWTKQGASAADYKTLNRVRFGEMPDPDVVPEGGTYPDKSVSDERESYAVEKRGMLFSISLEALVNDDMDAVSRIPAMQGNAMRRKINKVVYAILTANAALSDGIALFHSSSHGANLDATALAAGAPLDTGFQVMMTQSGISSDSRLNITPRFLIVPAALSATALKITRSIGDPSVGGDTTGHSNVANLYGGKGAARPLTVVADAQLDGSSTTAWWLSAGSGIDTVEVTFLQGEESPVLEREIGFSVDAIRYKIRQSFNAKALDFRGLYQGNS